MTQRNHAKARRKPRPPRISKRTGREPLEERFMVRVSSTDYAILQAIAAERGSDCSTVAREYIRAAIADRRGVG